MANQNTFTYSQGSGDPIDVVIRDGNGAAITTYTGSETLVCTVWPGGNRAVSFSPTAMWTDPTAGTISIAITGSETNALAPGTYRLLLRIDDGGGSLVDAYECGIKITRSAGSDVATAVYTTFEDLETAAGSWLSQVSKPESEAGFNEEQEQAREDLESAAHAHFTTGGLALPGLGGPIIVGGRSQWLQDQFDAGNLLVTPQVRRACANRALAIICEGMIGAEAGDPYGRLARMYNSKWEYLASCLTLEIIDNSNTVARIYLGSVSPLHG